MLPNDNILYSFYSFGHSLHKTYQKGLDFLNERRIGVHTSSIEAIL